MFEGWANFYLLIGGAAGALIGLLFIVLTLIRAGAGGLQLRAAAAYMTPNVAHLALVLVMSASATAPGLTGREHALLFLAGALACLAFTGRALFMLVSGGIKASHWTDVWAYGVTPFVATLALIASAVGAWLLPEWAARGVAASLAAMLLIAVRNAWDLVTWITAKGDSVTREG